MGASIRRPRMASSSTASQPPSDVSCRYIGTVARLTCRSQEHPLLLPSRLRKVAVVASRAGTQYPRLVRTQRQTVDYALRRRSLLREVYSDRVGTYEVCDASPYLRNAARFHGAPTDERCPVCRQEHLTNVHYIYGDELKASSGQARRA